MSAEDLKKSLEDYYSLREYFNSQPDFESIRLDILAIIQPERKAAVEEYKLDKLENYKAEMIGRAPATSPSNKKQLITEFAMTALTGAAIADLESRNIAVQSAIKIAVDAAQKLDKLEL